MLLKKIKLKRKKNAETGQLLAYCLDDEPIICIGMLRLYLTFPSPAPDKLMVYVYNTNKENRMQISSLTNLWSTVFVDGSEIREILYTQAARLLQKFAGNYSTLYLEFEY
jgi:hypothetical protein